MHELIVMDSELKRRQKQREREAAKASKAPPPAASASKTEKKPAEDDLNPNVSHILSAMSIYSYKIPSNTLNCGRDKSLL